MITIGNKFDIGEEVIIKLINCRGHITAICTRDNFSFEYELSYYLGDNFYITWMSDYQISKRK